MNWLTYGSGFAMATVVIIGGVGCSGNVTQDKDATIETGHDAGVSADKLAVEAEPEPSEVGQPEAAELDGEKADGEVVDTPLDQIWAVNMPGTYKLTANKHSRTGKYVSAEGPILHDIFRNLHVLSDGKQSKAGFAVAGTGMEALKNLRAVLTGDQELRTEFDDSGEITIVFFSLEFGTDVFLDEVTRHDNRIKVRYRFVPRVDAGVGSNLALIPLGRLPPGETTVELIASMDDKFAAWEIEPIPKEIASRIVCKPHRFVVIGSALD
jgi:hypothetical protein